MSQGTTENTSAATKECPFCAERVNLNAKKCKHCGETIDVTLRMAEEAKRASAAQGGNIVVTTSLNNAATQQTTAAAPPFPVYPPKSRLAFVILALLLGGLGFHNFYAGYTGRGLLELLFCWTLIPSVIALFEALLVTRDAKGIPFV